MASEDQRRREIVAALRGVALFHGLSDEELAGLAARMVRKRYARDEVVFGQGEPGRGLYLIASVARRMDQHAAARKPVPLLTCHSWDPLPVIGIDERHHELCTHDTGVRAGPLPHAI